MTTKLVLKKSSVSGKIPADSDLVYGELAINYANGRLFYKNSSNLIKNFIDSDIINTTIDAKLAAAGVGDSNQILTLITQNSIDSAGVINLVDSAYVQLRETYSTSSDLLEAIKQVDGNGSGLNADLLDSQEGSYYLDYNNFTNTPNVLDSADVLSTVAADGYTKFDSDNASGLITTAINNLVDGAPAALDTLNELAAAIGDDSNFIGSITTLIDNLPDSAQVSTIITADVDKAFVDALNVDADTLDGQDGTYYLDYTNFTNTPNVLDSADVLATVGAGGYATQTYVDNAVAALPDSAQVSAIISADVDAAFINALTIDADTLGGQAGSYYLDYTNFTNTPNVLDSADVLATVTADGFTKYDSGNATGQITSALVGYATETYVDNAVAALPDSAQVRGLFSASGDLSYNSGTGQFSVTTYKSTDFDSDFASKSTTDLSEGSNLYYTTARIDSDIDARVNKTFVDNLNVDADTLDGQDGTYYLDYVNFTNTPNVLDSADVSQIINESDLGIDSAAVTSLIDSDYVQARVPIASARTIGQVVADSASSIAVDTFNISDYRSAVYNIQLTSVLGYESLELRVIHDDINTVEKVSVLSNLIAFDLSGDNLSAANQSQVGEFATYIDFIDSSDKVVISFTPYHPNTIINFERLVHPNVGSLYLGRTDLENTTTNNVDLQLYQGNIDLQRDSGNSMDLLLGNQSYDLDSDSFNTINLN